MNKFSISNWFTQEFSDKLLCRFETQKIGLNLLNQICEYPVMVETGTLRMDNDWGAGMSTFVFGRYIEEYGGSLITIDNSMDNMNVCKVVTERYKSHITYIVENSLEYIPRIIKKIDFLYLDSMDCPINGDASISQEHNLNEFLLCESKLSDNAVIMIDDVDFPNGGKALLTHKYLFDNGYLLISKNQQSVWLKY